MDVDQSATYGISGVGFTNEDFESITLPELYLRLCITDPKGEA